MTNDALDQLREFMSRCFKHDGPYPLSSGRTAAYYYDGKLATLNPAAAWLIGNILVDPLLEAGAEAVGGPEVGAIPIADAVGIAAHLRGRPLPTFIVRKAPKSHGTRSQVAEAHTGRDEPLLTAGRRVAIVEDVITTGGSIQQAIDVVRSLGCEIAVVATLVERHESGGTALRGQGFPVLRIFYTDADGHLFTDEEFLRRAAATPPLLTR